MKKTILLQVLFILAFAVGAIHAQDFYREISHTYPRMYGKDVEELQKKLLAYGFKAVGEVDGWYGPMTEEGVIQFQLLSGFEPDGVVDETVWNILMLEDSGNFTPHLNRLAEWNAVKLSGLEEKTQDLVDISTEGATLTTWSKDNEVVLAEMVVTGEMGKVHKTYHFLTTRRKILVMEEWKYPSPFDIENAEKTREVFYLTSSERWLVERGRYKATSYDFEEDLKLILEEQE